MMLFDKLIKLAIKKKFISATISLILILIGVYSLKTLDIEAYPDFTNPIVQVITQMPGKSAEEVERLATIPLEKNLNGIPNEQKLYSSSLFGLSVIKVVFADGLPSSLIRQQVLERVYQTDIRVRRYTMHSWYIIFLNDFSVHSTYLVYENK